MKNIIELRQLNQDSECGGLGKEREADSSCCLLSGTLLQGQSLFSEIRCFSLFLLSRMEIKVLVFFSEVEGKNARRR